MKTLEQRGDGQNVLHSNKTPQELVREKFSDTCILQPQTPPMRSIHKGIEHCKAYYVMDRNGCEKGEESYTGTNLVEIPE